MDVSVEAGASPNKSGGEAADGQGAPDSGQVAGGAIQRFVHQRMAIGGLFFIGLIVLVSVLAGFIAPYDPNKQNLAVAFQSFSGAHWLGTDEFGRDELSRIIYGARLTLLISALAVLLGVTVGVLLGLISGYFGRWWDTLIQRLNDVMLVFGAVILALFLVSVFGPGVRNVVIAVGLSLVPVFVRLTRGSVLSVREELYVQAARASGGRSLWILRRHILPNVLTPIVAMAALGMGISILATAGLGFLGLGVPSPTAEWGAMMGGGRTYLFSDSWLVTIPGIFVILSVLACNFVGDGIQAALNPRSEDAEAVLVPRSARWSEIGHRITGTRQHLAHRDGALPEAAHESDTDPSVVLKVSGLTTQFRGPAGVLPGVTDISFDLHAGEVLGVLGESGSGKSVTVLSILGLLPDPPARVVSGAVSVAGTEIMGLPSEARRAVVGTNMSVIFQDPLNSFNPVLRVGAQVAEAVLIRHPELDRWQAREKVLDTFQIVGLNDVERRFDQYPHEFSGGMLQRAMIAMAIINEPKVLVADEPTTALDVTIQAQVLDALRIAQERIGAATILITHDIGVLAEMSDRIMVMYAGRVVESGPLAEILREPKHPYTKGLLSSVPMVDGPIEELQPIPGQPPRIDDVPSGCAFRTRCALAQPHCSEERPALVEVSLERKAACHLLGDQADRHAMTAASTPGSSVAGNGR